MVRVAHVDALDVARLSSKFPDVRIYARDSNNGGACIDVYVPYRVSKIVLAASYLPGLLNIMAVLTVAWGSRILMGGSS